MNLAKCILIRKFKHYADVHYAGHKIDHISSTALGIICQIQPRYYLKTGDLQPKEINLMVQGVLKSGVHKYCCSFRACSFILLKTQSKSGAKSRVK